jgi:high-affinity K+ transport system ATPase subunit B
MSSKEKWSELSPKVLTENFINHIYKDYYKDYLRESRRYERINNWLFALIALIGLLTTILLSFQEIYKEALSEYTVVQSLLRGLLFILPAFSSFLAIYAGQKGLKKKEELREEARIRAKHLVNTAKIRFSTANEDVNEYVNIHNWLNHEMKMLQLQQAQGYFAAHNNSECAK